MSARLAEDDMRDAPGGSERTLRMSEKPSSLGMPTPPTHH